MQTVNMQENYDCYSNLVHASASASVAYWINCLPTLQLYDAVQTLSAVIGKLMKEGKTDEVDSTKAQVNDIALPKYWMFTM
jgi:hypothetical protein